MLTARNARRAAAGRPTVDVEEELARLAAPAVDAALRGADHRRTHSSAPPEARTAPLSRL